MAVILVFKDIYISQSRKWLRHSKTVHMLGDKREKKIEKEKQDISTTRAYLLGKLAYGFSFQLCG